MQKRGTSQIDWIVSLAIFLLYIAWFFVFISPQMNFSSNKNSLGILLKSEFNKEFEWELTKFPLFVESNDTGILEPILINYSSNRTDIKFTDSTNFVLWNNKMILLANVSSEVKTYWILEGGSYNQSFNYSGLNVQENVVTTENISVRFDDSLPDSANYKDREKFDNGQYKINDVAFTPTSNSYEEKSFVGIYTARTGNLNHTSLVFLDNQDVYNFITADTDSSYTFTIDLDLDNYASYYSDNNNYGDFGYTNDTQSLNYSHNYVTIYGSTALTMYFENNVEFNFTYYNTTLDLTIDMPIDNNYEYRFSFHDGDYDDTEKVYYDARFGVVETLEGIYLNNISTNYSYYKEQWNFPRNFNLRVYKNSSAYSYLYDPAYTLGSFKPGRKPVYAETQDLFELTNNGEYKPISVNYRIW